MLQIPIQPIPSQTLKTVLAGQNCQIFIYHKAQGLFFDMAVNGAPLVAGIVARDAVPLVCRKHDEFAGNLMFVDTQGTSDPEYLGLGSRYTLVYLTAEEYALL